jgi:hypothetical protein
MGVFYLGWNKRMQSTVQSVNPPDTMVPTVRAQDPTAIHDRGNREKIDDMTQKGKRYNPDKMVQPCDGEAWRHFDDKHCEKAYEARNAFVALAIDGFNH